MKVGILGGGLTGLTIGYLLKKQNLDFEILEKNNECGGLCRTMQECGFTFDIAGGHIIFSKDKEVLNFKLDILGDNKVRSKRNTKILYKDVFVKYPFENGLSGLSKEDNFECLNGFVKTINQKYDIPKNFNEWIYQTFGNGIAEKYMIPYNEKIWNFKTENMATFWVDGRIPKPPSEDIIKSSLGIETEGYIHQSHFYYPKQGGIQALTDSIEDKIKDNITKEFRITSIKKEAGKWAVYGNNEKKIFDQIVSTIPVIDLIKLLDEVPEEIMNAINNLKYNSLITVMLGVDTDKLNDLHWLYIPDKNVLPHRLVFPKNNTPNTTPEGKSSIVAEITFNEGDDISRMTDEEIVKKVIADLDEKKIIDKNLVCYQKLIRLKYAYVVYDLEYEKNIIKIHKFFEEKGIDLCGRFSEYRYINMDACIRSAMNYVESNNFTQ